MTPTEGLTQVNTIATHTALTLWSGASDFLIILVLFALFFLFAWYMGRAPLVALLLAFYCAYSIYIIFPYMSYLPAEPAMTALLARIGVYLGLSFVFFLILHRVIISDFLYVGILGIIILSFLGATFLIALAYHIFPVVNVYDFTPAVDLLFASKAYFFWWFSAPAVGLFLFAR